MQLAAGADAELGEDLAQVPFDRARGQEQLGADLGVGAAVAGQPGDLLLLRREPVARLGAALAYLLAVSLTAKEFRYSFGNALSEEESNALHERWTIPSPARPLFEAAAAAFSPHSPAKVDTANEERGPLLLTMGGKDHTVPEAITKSTLKQYRHSDAVTDLVEFADRGHSLTIDAGWREVAEACLACLSKQGR